jgi:hypothetical protein
MQSKPTPCVFCHAPVDWPTGAPASKCICPSCLRQKLQAIAPQIKIEDGKLTATMKGTK